MSHRTPVPNSLHELTGSWALDPAHTRVGFVARHAMVTKVRGAFNELDGRATVGRGGVTDSTIDLVIQVGSIDTRNAQRDGHLLSSDFFDSDSYPEIRFTSSWVKVDGSTLQVTGDLAIKDVTRQITIPFEFQGAAVDPFGNLRAGFEGTTVVNRRDFGLVWNAPLEAGGVLVSDRVTLEFEVSAIRQD